MVDECQDFKEPFFELCSVVTARQVFLAGDIFQTIFEENVTKDYSVDYFLTRCYRTDPKTLMFAHSLGLGIFEKHPMRWLNKDDWEACGYGYTSTTDGKKIILSRDPIHRFVDVPDDYECVKLVTYRSESFYQQLCEIIREIKQTNPTCAPNDVCIILLDTDQRIYGMANMIETFIDDEFGWKVNKAYETKRSIDDTLLVSNRNNVKGLEYPFVICVSEGLQNDYIYRNALYTMLSRSFIQTIFMVSVDKSEFPTEIKSGYKQIMSEGKMTIHMPSSSEIASIETRFQKAKRRKPFENELKEIMRDLQIGMDQYDIIYSLAMRKEWDKKEEYEVKDLLNKLASVLK